MVSICQKLLKTSGRILFPEMYSEPCKTSKMRLYAKIVTDVKLKNNSAKKPHIRCFARLTETSIRLHIKLDLDAENNTVNSDDITNI